MTPSLASSNGYIQVASTSQVPLWLIAELQTSSSPRPWSHLMTLSLASSTPIRGPRRFWTKAVQMLDHAFERALSCVPMFIHLHRALAFFSTTRARPQKPTHRRTAQAQAHSNTEFNVPRPHKTALYTPDIVTSLKVVDACTVISAPLYM